MKEDALSEVKDDLSKYLPLAETAENCDHKARETGRRVDRV